MIKPFLRAVLYSLIISALCIATLEAYTRFSVPKTFKTDEKATLFINSFPPGADVTISGKKVADKTPVRLYDLAPKEVEILVAKEGYRETKQKIDLKTDKANRLEVSLLPITAEKIQSGFTAYANAKEIVALGDAKDGAAVISKYVYKDKINITGVTPDGLWYKVTTPKGDGFIKANDQISRLPIFAHVRYQSNLSIGGIKINVFAFAPEDKKAEVADSQNFIEPLMNAAKKFHQKALLNESTLTFEFKNTLNGSSFINLSTNYNAKKPAAYTYQESLTKELSYSPEIVDSKDELILNLVVAPPFSDADKYTDLYDAVTTGNKHILLLSTHDLATASVNYRENSLYALIARGFGVYSPFNSNDANSFEDPLSNKKINDDILSDLGINVGALK